MSSTLSSEELEHVKFMLAHLTRFDEKANALIRGSGIVLVLVASLSGFLLTLITSEKIVIFFLLFIPVVSLSCCVIFSSLLLWPKFTVSPFFTKETYEKIEYKYIKSLMKKDKWIKMGIISLIFGLLSYSGWLLYYFYIYIVYI